MRAVAAMYQQPKIVARYSVDGNVSLLADGLMRHIANLADGVRVGRVVMGKRDVQEIQVREVLERDGSVTHDFNIIPGVDPDNCD